MAMTKGLYTMVYSPQIVDKVQGISPGFCLLSNCYQEP